MTLIVFFGGGADAPCDPAPCDPAPGDPAPCDPAPGDAPCDPAPCDPAPCDPAPCDPAPEDPAPAPEGKATILLVDTSYVVFAKYYSALSWYKSSINKNPDVSSVFGSAVFQKKFADMFGASVDGVIDKMCEPSALVVFARDCSRSSVWRRAHYEGYKENRAMNSTFNCEAFGHAYGQVIPQWLSRRGGGGVLGAAGAEGDDVIGVIHAHVRDGGRGDVVAILTNDNDYIQLADDRTRLVNLLHQDVACRRGGLTPEQYLRFRILSGDRADNIPSVAARCGPKTACKLVAEHDEEALRIMYGDVYHRNDLLMNMRNVPGDIREDIVRQFLELKPLYTTISSRAL
jgi:5'-3' exonuclease